MRKLILLQGAPGCGKSTLAKALTRIYSGAQIRSADTYWYEIEQPDKPEEYSWNAEKAHLAHKWCQLMVLRDMQEPVSTIIVDNTTTTRKEALPYRVLANMFGYEVEVIRIDPGVEECLRRQQERPEDRRVPEDVIRKMYARMEDLIPDEDDFYRLTITSSVISTSQP